MQDRRQGATFGTIAKKYFSTWSTGGRRLTSSEQHQRLDSLTEHLPKDVIAGIRLALPEIRTYTSARDRAASIEKALDQGATFEKVVKKYFTKSPKGDLLYPSEQLKRLNSLAKHLPGNVIEGIRLALSTLPHARKPTVSKPKAPPSRKAPKQTIHTGNRDSLAGHLLPENEILGIQTALPHAKTPTPSKPKAPASSALPTIPAPLKPSSAKPTTHAGKRKAPVSTASKPKSRSARPTHRNVKVSPGRLGIDLCELDDGRVAVWRVHSWSPLSGFISRGNILVAIDGVRVGRHQLAAVKGLLTTRDTCMHLSFLGMY